MTGVWAARESVFRTRHTLALTVGSDVGGFPGWSQMMEPRGFPRLSQCVPVRWAPSSSSSLTAELGGMSVSDSALCLGLELVGTLWILPRDQLERVIHRLLLYGS